VLKNESMLELVCVLKFEHVLKFDCVLELEHVLDPQSEAPGFKKKRDSQMPWRTTPPNR
jgi:hypothetical protein